ncbi:MAG: winged helix-turn-helix domain-containing protein [Candidatus Diapherotrites archaeon]|nr:winged helix-turn-helix domain-containing protein [Candidatus Diapherotrites archaeon]
MEEQQELVIDNEQLKALSSDTRVEILKLLSGRKYTVSEIAKRLNCSKSTIHEHIRKLEEAKLVERVESNYAPKWVYYRLTNKGTMFFDKSRRVVLLLAGILLVLAFLQFFLYFFNLPQIQIKDESIMKSVDSEVPQLTKRYEYTEGQQSHSSEAQSHAAESSFKISREPITLLLATSCLILGTILTVYALKRKPKLKLNLGEIQQMEGKDN